MFDVTCIKCGSNKIKYECNDCGVSWCEKCAKENDYECTECPPGDLIRLKKPKYDPWNIGK